MNATPVALVVAHVAEHHRLDVDGGAEVVGMLVQRAVVDRAAVFHEPNTAADRHPQLLVRVFGEIAAGVAA